MSNTMGVLKETGIVVGRVCVAHLFSFLCCVVGRVCVAHLFTFICCFFVGFFVVVALFVIVLCLDPDIVSVSSLSLRYTLAFI